jgi:hypothetical protein
MKAFEIKGCVALTGIPIREGKIEVGEAGRGRKLPLVPLPTGAVVQEDRLMEADGAHGACVVLIRDHAGYRGAWYIRDARTTQEWDQVIAREAAIAAHNATAYERHQASWYEGGCEKCRQEKDAFAAAQPALPAERPAAWKVIAQGSCAQGDAGRMGGGPEYLAILTAGEAVEIVRSGRLYGEPAVVRVENREGEIIISRPRQEAEERAAASRW